MTRPEYRELLLDEWSLWREKENLWDMVPHLTAYGGVFVCVHPGMHIGVSLYCFLSWFLTQGLTLNLELPD